MEKQQNSFLTLEQVCQRYAISRWTLYRWTSKNSIPHIKVGSLIRFKEQELQDWEESSKSTQLKVALI